MAQKTYHQVNRLTLSPTKQARHDRMVKESLQRTAQRAEQRDYVPGLYRSQVIDYEAQILKGAGLKRDETGRIVQA